jgi:outer membrane lipoprotein-sorting protein
VAPLIRPLALLGLAGLAGLAQAAFGLDQLMQELARHPGGRARFVETRYLAVLDKPIVATGELAYAAPDRLEKHTRTPRPETLVLDKERLTMERDKRRLTIDLGQYPEVRAFVDSLRGTLSGNRGALEKSYALHLSGNAEAWLLVLLPGDEKVAAYVQRIDVAGSGSRIRRIEYRQADGDRSVMSIEPIEAR